MSSEVALFYGNKWCPDCRRARLIFDRYSYPYDFLDTDQNNEARQKVMQINHGNCSVPTIIFPDGTILTEPTNQTLESKILSVQEKHS